MEDDRRPEYDLKSLRVRKLGHERISFDGATVGLKSRINLIKQKFEKVVSATTSTDQISVDQRHKIISHGSCTFAFSGEGVDHYNELIQITLETKDWQKKFSEKYVQNTVNQILSKLLCEDSLDKISHYIEELDREYSGFSSQQVVYLPVTGIWIESDEIKIGNVQFIQPSQDIFDKIIEQTQPITYSTSDSRQTQDAMMEELRQALPKHFSRNRGKIFAKTSFVAEPVRAKERAEEEVRRSLEILRLFIPLETILQETKDKIQIGLEGEIVSGSRFSISISDNNFSTSYDNTGGMQPFILNAENIDIINRNGFLTLSDIISKEQLNPYEETLLRAVHWFSSSRMQLESENALLNLITSIEVLLTPRDGNPIGTGIAEGIALLLADNFEDRKKIKDKFKKLYNNRSAVSHGGNKSISKSDIFYLINLAYSLLVCLCKRTGEFSDHKSLLTYIEELKLS